MANVLAHIINPYGDVYPDDMTAKTVVLQAQGMEPASVGDRHVLLRWTNHIDKKENYYTQIIQLSGGPGNYNFYHPVVKQQSKASMGSNTFYNLGTFTRAQRDRIVEIARGLDFNMKTRVNSCRTWTRLLFIAMVEEGLLSQEIFDRIDKEVPLRKPLPDA